MDVCLAIGLGMTSGNELPALRNFWGTWVARTQLTSLQYTHASVVIY